MGPRWAHAAAEGPNASLIWKIFFPPDFLRSPWLFRQLGNGQHAWGWSSYPLGCLELFDAIFLDSPLIAGNSLHYIFK